MLIFFQNLFSLFLERLSYGVVVFLMAIESSLIPFPSELVVPPAAYLAAKGELNLYLVILAGVLGSLIGAIFNYFLALTLGRKIIYSFSRSRLGKILLLSPKKFKKAENYFLKYGKASTFFGRLVPVIRQLISIPAGLAKMNLLSFVFYTFLGSLIWSTILALLGYFLGSNTDLLSIYFKEISWGFLILFLIICLVWIKKNSKKKK